MREKTSMGAVDMLSKARVEMRSAFLSFLPTIDDLEEGSKVAQVLKDFPLLNADYAVPESTLS